MKAPIELEGETHPFARKLTLPDGVLLAASVGFIVLTLIVIFTQVSQPNLYVVLHEVHFHLSRYGLAVGGIMLVLAVYIGIIRKGDVSPWFRRGTYVVFGTMLIQALIGVGILIGYGIQPSAPEHLIYGAGTVLSLPFFIFVETTAKKRPAMGSYIWGFTLLVGVMIRAISTG